LQRLVSYAGWRAPVVAILPHATREAVEDALAKGARLTLEKPFSLERLVETVCLATGPSRRAA
jgi:DNA-binding NtrC family response regulator